MTSSDPFPVRPAVDAPRPPWRRHLAARWHLLPVAVALAVLVLARCVANPVATPPPAPEGMAFVACGQRCAVDAPVVLWTHAPNYDAYQTRKRFADDEPDGKLRYAPVRGNLPAALAARAGADGLDLADLQQVVHQFVLHFDVAGTSRQCFKILQDVRTLSVHFLLDVDGTIYQTLDLREKAWHATIANDYSIGVEIAHPGDFPQPLGAPMRTWYEKDAQGWRVKFPKWMTELGIRTPDFVARPDRPDVIAGEVQGRTLYQFDYTPQQYRSLIALCAALNRVFPRIRLDAPRDAAGAIRTSALPAEELAAFDGIVGHFHVQTNKTDPGPAFQWERVLQQAREQRAKLR